MEYQGGFYASGGSFLYLAFFILAAIAIYFMKKNERKELDSQNTKSNVIYLNFTSRTKNEKSKK